MRLLLITLAVYASTYFCNAQSIEVGYVKEYNGKNAKTPLEGVELNVIGAPTTHSDSNGKFNLKFDVLKPGSVVKYNEIHKSGFVIFNEEALKVWKISNNMTPFVIVMCKKSEFEALIKKYYGLMERSYKTEYEKQKAEAVAAKKDTRELQNKLDELERTYKEKMSNIYTYVEAFSRIDESEISAIEAEVLQLVKEGLIEEAIKKFEELKLNDKTREQLEKLAAGNEMINAGKSTADEAQADLLSLAESYKRQIGLYEMGTWSEEKTVKKNEVIAQLVEIYNSLKASFGDVYNNELGKWMVKQLEYVNDRDSYLELAKKAADLPSVDGLYALGNVYEYMSIDNDDMMMKARDCYTKSIELADPEDTLNKAKVRMEMLPDFSVRAANADIYYRIVSEEEHTVYICNKSLLQHNAPEGDFIVPAYINFREQKHRVIGIDEGAFMNNRKLQSIVLPSTIQHIGKEAFRGCTSLKYCKFEGDVMKIEENNRQNTIPEEVVLSVPNNSYHMMDWLSNRITKMGETRNKKSVKAYESLLLQFVENKNTSNEDKISYYEQLMDIYADSLHGVYNLRKARKCLEKIIELDRDRLAEYHFYIGVLFQKEKRYANAWKYYRKAFDEGFYYALNNMAYMYALGLGVPVDLKKAHETIDQAIKLIPDEANFYDSKGELYLMQEDTVNAKRYCEQAQNLIRKYYDENNSLYKDYISNSTLYKTLYGNANDNYDTLNTKNLARSYLTLVKIVAKIAYKKFTQYNAIYSPNYEELLAIGIIAINALFKTKTIEELKYLETKTGIVLMPVILHELKERYPLLMFFYYGYADNDKEIMFANEKESKILNVYQTKYRMYSLIKNEVEWLKTKDFFPDYDIIDNDNIDENHFEDDYIDEILKDGDIINRWMDDLPDTLRFTINKVFEDGKTVKTLARELGLSEENLLKDIEQACSNLNEKIRIK